MTLSVLGLLVNSTPSFAILVLVSFLIVGWNLVVGRYLFESTLVDRTRYALTDQRVFTWSGVFRPSQVDIPLSTMLHFEMRSVHDEYGTIVFAKRFYPHPNSFRAFLPQLGAASIGSGLYMNPAVREVYGRIQEARCALIESELMNSGS